MAGVENGDIGLLSLTWACATGARAMSTMTGGS